MTYLKNELEEILTLHSKWLNDEEGGSRADLQSADLRFADLRAANLQDANLRFANLRFANLQSADLRFANLQSADFQSADLRFADLRSTDLQSTDLQSANLDFSCLHFSCKTLPAKFDQKHIIQLLYHAAMPAQKNRLTLDADIIELFNSDLFMKIVNKFHRRDECGIFNGVKTDEN